MKKILVGLMVLGLVGCSSTYVGKASDASRQKISVGGYDISVIKDSESTYQAFGGESFDYNAVKLKQAQIKAIEIVSGCSVTDSEYSNTFVRTLHAQVKC